MIHPIAPRKLIDATHEALAALAVACHKPGASVASAKCLVAYYKLAEAIKDVRPDDEILQRSPKNVIFEPADMVTRFGL